MIYDSVLGPHQEIITAKASDKKITSKAQDGGIVSAILIYKFICQHLHKLSLKFVQHFL